MGYSWKLRLRAIRRVRPAKVIGMDPAQPARPSHWYRDFDPTDISDPDVTVQLDALCKACLRVGPWLQDNRGVEESQRQPLTHSKSGQALEKAYKDGCHFCTLLWQSLVETDIMTRFADGQKVDRNTRTGQVREGSEVDLFLRMAFGERAVSDTKFSIRPHIKLVDGDVLDGQPLPVRLGPAPLQPQTPLADSSRVASPSAGGISTSTGSELSLVQARTWLDECTRTHPRCQRQISSIPPRRLLAVSRRPAGIHLQLKHSDELQDPVTLKWVCLSYCWGVSSTTKLTRSTYTSLQQGIMADGLPKTIRDAASVVLALGLEFLWVDALCIMQDSIEDWQREAERMGDIYSGSILTLAALGAADSSVGLFASRDPLIYSKCHVPLPNSEVGAVYPAWSDYSGFGTCSEKPWPLNTRGWVVQERILPRRALRFGPILSWECWQSAVSEFDPGDHGIQGSGPESLSSRFYQHVIDLGHPRDQILPRETKEEEEFLVRGLWYWIVYEFTATSFTVLTDRATAILGLVSAIALRTGWQYLAGYWLPLTLGDLLWQKQDSQPQIESQRTGLAPSWSWMSITGRVAIFPVHLPPENECLAEIEGVDDKERTVRLSCLRLPMGPLRDAAGEKISRAPPKDWPYHSFISWEDVPANWQDVGEVYLLPLFLKPFVDDMVELEGLLVSPSRLYPGAYERIGSAKTHMYDENSRPEMAPVFETLRHVGRRETVILV